MGELHAACDEDRTNIHLGFTELGRQVAFLAAGENELRSSVAELTHEMERLRQERSSRRKLSLFSTFATRIRAAFSSRGVA